MVHLDYRDTRPIYTQIADGFLEQILAGILPEGEKLPSVRELAAELSINPNTIQRAYRELEAAGWIATVPGKGCFVCGVPKSGTPASRQNLLDEFDRVTSALIAAGVSREDLVRMLLQGGNEHA